MLFFFNDFLQLIQFFVQKCLLLVVSLFFLFELIIELFVAIL